METTNRRLHDRLKKNSEVWCYFDGSCMDARSADISRGGAFIRTADHTDIPIGVTVGVWFRAQGKGESIFLFGRVVRIQAGPQKGFGLQWLKAVGFGTDDELARFLKERLGITSPVITQEKVDEATGSIRSVYRFPTPESKNAGPGPAPQPVHDASPRPSAHPLQHTPFELRSPVTPPAREGDARPKAGRLEQDTFPPPARYSSMAYLRRSGERKSRALVRPIAVDVMAGESVLHARITSLGLPRLYISTAFQPIDLVENLTLSFRLLTREGDTKILALCHMVSVDTNGPGLDVKVVKLDEGTNPGVMVRYIKWLECQALEHA